MSASEKSTKAADRLTTTSRTRPSSDGETKVPFLGDIPGLGFFFREQSNLRKRTELVVIIRPYITTTPNEASLISQKFLNKNSIHPNSPRVDNLNIYSNNDKRHKGYQLEKPFKEYDLQDRWDHYHDKGERARHKNYVAPQSQNDYQPSEKQKAYVELTEYASKSVRLAANEREVVEDISPAKLTNTHSADLLYDSRIRVVPVASWRKGDGSPPD